MDPTSELCYVSFFFTTEYDFPDPPKLFRRIDAHTFLLPRVSLWLEKAKIHKRVAAVKTETPCAAPTCPTSTVVLHNYPCRFIVAFQWQHVRASEKIIHVRARGRASSIGRCGINDDWEFGTNIPFANTNESNFIYLKIK